MTMQAEGRGRGESDSLILSARRSAHPLVRHARFYELLIREKFSRSFSSPATAASSVPLFKGNRRGSERNAKPEMETTRRPTAALVSHFGNSPRRYSDSYILNSEIFNNLFNKSALYLSSFAWNTR